MISASRRDCIGAGLALIGLSACSGYGRADALRLATGKGGVDTALDAAGQGGIPYPINRINFSGGNLVTEAIYAGAIDLGAMSEIPPVFTDKTNGRLKLVAVQRGDVNHQVALVQRDSPIRSLDALKGKRVGFVRATTSHYFLLRLLGEQGLTLADIQPVALSPQDGRAAFDKGSLDIWIIYGAPGLKARADTGARVLARGAGRFSGNYVWAAQEDTLNDPRGRARIIDYLHRVRATCQWAETHPEHYAALISRETGISESLLLQQHCERSEPATLGRVTPEAIQSQQQVADSFCAVGLLPRYFDVRPLWSHALDADI